MRARAATYHRAGAPAPASMQCPQLSSAVARPLLVIAAPFDSHAVTPAHLCDRLALPTAHRRDDAPPTSPLVRYCDILLTDPLANKKGKGVCAWPAECRDG